MRQGVINQLRSLLNAYKITGFGDKLTTIKAIRKLWHLEWPTEELAAVGQAWVMTLVHLGEAIAHLDHQLEEMAKDDRVSGMRNTLPGVGPVTASVLVYELGDVTRFAHSRSVACYAGLVPRVNQSADTAHHGGLTKRGNRELRYVLGEWAIRLLACDERVARWAKPKLRRSHKNKVRMALARRLLIGVYKMLRTGESFSMERCLGM
jgi:transposase